VKEFIKYEILLKVGDENRSIVIDKPSFIIGRSQKNDISIQHDLVSREHLKVFLKGDEIYIEELGSSNGSWHNGVKLKARKSVLFSNDTPIKLGNDSGPVIWIKCLFNLINEPVEIPRETPDRNSNAFKVDDFEEVTLVRNNPLIEKTNIQNNVLALKSDKIALDELGEVPLPRVSNGFESTRSEPFQTSSRNSPVEKIRSVKMLKDLPVRAAVEPDLLVQMKNLLDIEAENAAKQSKREADEIKEASQKKGEEILAKARSEAIAERIKTEEQTRLAQEKAYAEIEKLKIANDKKIESLLSKAQKDSNAILQKNTSEANKIKADAERYSEDLKLKANEQSKKTILESENFANTKHEEFKQIEEENQQKLKKINETYLELRSKIDALKQSEFEAQNNYDNLIRNIRLEDERIKNERISLEQLRLDLATSKKESEQQLSDLRFEERNLKAQHETILLEQKLLVTQIISEGQQAKILKDNLIIENSALKNDKEKLERTIRETEADHYKQIQKLDQLKKDDEIAQAELLNTKEQQKRLSVEIESQKNLIKSSMSKLQSDELISQEKVQKLNAATVELNHKIEREARDFERQKLENISILQVEKNKQLKIIEKDVEISRTAYSEEVVKFKNLKAKMHQEIERIKLEFESFVKKNKDDEQLIQRAFLQEAEKQKMESNNQINHLKNKFENLNAQLTRDHLDAKKSLSSEISKIDLSKKQLDLEYKILMDAQQEKISKMENEFAQKKLDVEKNADIEKQKIAAEIATLRLSFNEIKEAELNNIRVIKENAQKDFYSKKAERAKAVTTNIDGVFLTELNKYRNKKMNDLFIESCSKEVSNIIYDTLMEKVQVDKVKLEFAMKVKTNAKEEATFLRKLMTIFFVISLIFLAFKFVPKLLNEEEVSKEKLSPNKTIK
jgi:pSer/pThr/pTyr-binding forkhead associated (FHA) protein